MAQTPKLEWDDRLMPRSRAFNLAGGFPIRLVQSQSITGAHTDGGEVVANDPVGTPVIECVACDGRIVTITGAFTLDLLVGRVLGHMVMSHDQSLSATGGGHEPR